MFEGWEFAEPAGRPAPSTPALDDQEKSVDTDIDALEAEAEAAFEAAGRPRWFPDARPASEAGAIVRQHVRLLDMLPYEYRRAVVATAAREVEWPLGESLPDLHRVLRQGLEFTVPANPPRSERAYLWLKAARHNRLRPLAEAVARRLRVAVEQIGERGIALALASEEDLWQWAEDLAEIASATPVDGEWQEQVVGSEIASVADGNGQLQPVEQPVHGLMPSPSERRRLERQTHMRRLRREAGRADSWLAACLGLVGGRRGDGRPDFISYAGLYRWQFRQRRAAEYGRTHAIFDGKSGTALDVVMRAAAEARRAQVVAMTMGMVEAGKRQGLTPVFVTLTLPPEWHPNPSKGGQHHDPALSPAAAADHLQDLWHRVLAMLRKRRVKLWGLWVVEPHRDGCPHRHAVVWMRADEIGDLRECVEHHFPGEHQTEIRPLCDGAASAATYILTYVMKGLPSAERVVPDGKLKPTEEDHHGQWSRYRAWASQIGVRRWGTFGLRRGLTSLWRGIYGMKEAPAEPHARRVWRAMRKGKWATALALLGAWSRDPRLTLAYREQETRFGDTRRVVVGCADRLTGAATTWKTTAWRIVSASDLPRARVALVESDPRVGAGAPPSSGQTGQGAAAGPPRRPPRPPGEAPAKHQTDVAHREHERALVARIRTRADAAAAAGREAARQIACEVETDEAAAAAAQAGWNDAVAAILAADATLAAAVAAMAPT